MPAARTDLVQPRSLDELSVDECLGLLGDAGVGRMAFLAEGEPTIVPVNYVLHEGMIVFRTTYGATLDTIADGAAVAFEVDQLDPSTHTGWSIVLRGRGEEIWRPQELAVARDLPMTPWAPGDRAHYVRIMPASITGRRIR